MRYYAHARAANWTGKLDNLTFPLNLCVCHLLGKRWHLLFLKVCMHLGLRCNCNGWRCSTGTGYVPLPEIQNQALRDRPPD